MTRGRKVTTIALAVCVISLGAKSALSQGGSQPELRMLLNLDLFTPQTDARPSGDDDSTLHEIQTLRAMGYLNGTVKGSSNATASTTNSGSSEVQPPTEGKGGEVE